MQRLLCVSDICREQLVSCFSPPANQWVQPLLALATGEIKNLLITTHPERERQKKGKRERERERQKEREI